MISFHEVCEFSGYVYVIFDNERAVKFLLGSCVYDFNHGNHSFYYKVTSSRMRQKEVQVIPWQLANSNFVRNGCNLQMASNTVFVGSLHGMMTAEVRARRKSLFPDYSGQNTFSYSEKLSVLTNV